MDRDIKVSHQVGTNFIRIQIGLQKSDELIYPIQNSPQGNGQIFYLTHG